MPVAVDTPLTILSQAAFAEVSYSFMAEIFSLHRELGRLFDEKVYKNAVASRLDDIQTEVEIRVVFRDFQKSYFMDILASSGAVFELKTVDTLLQRHRSQLLNYLLLTGLKHGKLVNLRPEKVEHEFINAKQTLQERCSFSIHNSGFHSSNGFGSAEQALIIELIRDSGTGLERSLYEEAILHFIGDYSLSSNETDCQQMNEAEPWVLDPGPTSNASDQYEYKPEDHEDDERRVSHEYQVGS